MITNDRIDTAQMVRTARSSRRARYATMAGIALLPPSCPGGRRVAGRVYALK
jgi:hypothetical protein